MRILAVDDDAIICELLREAFEAAGYTDVVTASSGHEALASMRDAAQPFDCFLLDIQMPEMDGIELCSKIKSQPHHADSLIIMLTAMSEKDYIDRAFGAGATDYVTKPFDVLELFTRLKLAAQLVEQKAKVAEKQQTIDALKTHDTFARKVDLREDIYLSGVRGALQKLAFENYILQLGRSGMFGSAFFAFRFSNVKELHDNASPDEFVGTILDVGDVIADALKTTETFITYRGNGVYVAITKFEKNRSVTDVQAEIDADLAGLIAPLTNGEAVPISMAVGGPVQSGLFGAAESLDAMWRAIDLVEGSAAERGPAKATIADRVKKVTSQIMQSAAL